MAIASVLIPRIDRPRTEPVAEQTLDSDPMATLFEASPEPLYCVKEGRLPEIPPDCIVVERIEDVPKGATFVPAHGGLDDPEEIRRYWCTDYGAETPAPEEIPPECRKYFEE